MNARTGLFCALVVLIASLETPARADGTRDEVSVATAGSPAERAAPRRRERLTVTFAGGAETSRLYDLAERGGFGAMGVGVDAGFVRALIEGSFGAGRLDMLGSWRGALGVSCVYATRFRLYAGLAGDLTYFAIARASTSGQVGQTGVDALGVLGADIVHVGAHALALEARGGVIAFPETVIPTARLAAVFRY